NERDSALRPSTHRRSPLTVLRPTRALRPPSPASARRSARCTRRHSPPPNRRSRPPASPYPTPYAHLLPPSSAALASPRAHRTRCTHALPVRTAPSAVGPCRPRPAEAGADTAPTDAHVQSLAECAAATLHHARIAHALAVRATPPPLPDVSSVQSQVQARVQPGA
ncbi:hypothetical protein B0H14DRAFT_3039200, partial [Mycena olivaceomarginata]